VAGVSRYAAPDGHRLGGEDDGPKYERVADAIEADIKSGELPPGMRLQPERVLMAEFGVSYGTVRHAVKVLRDRGLVRTRHGEGNYVKARPAAAGPDQATEGPATEGSPAEGQTEGQTAEGQTAEGQAPDPDAP
jgi:DNA-binding FadR family transcriptional regulator